MKQFLIFFFLGTSFWLSGQNEGTLRLYLSPPAEAVAIDGNLMEFGNYVKLKPGKYFVQAWCPNKELLDTIIEIKANETLSFFYRFENSKVYNKYLAESNNYNNQRNLHFTLPATTTIIMAGALVYTYFKGKKAEDQAQESYLLYKYANSDIDLKRKDFEAHQNTYRYYYYAQFVEYTALAVSSYFLYKGVKWLVKNQKPTLQKDKNPFTVSQVGFVPNSRGGYGVGIVIGLD